MNRLNPDFSPNHRPVVSNTSSYVHSSRRASGQLPVLRTQTPASLKTSPSSAPLLPPPAASTFLQDSTHPDGLSLHPAHKHPTAHRACRSHCGRAHLSSTHCLPLSQFPTFSLPTEPAQKRCLQPQLLRPRSDQVITSLFRIHQWLHVKRLIRAFDNFRPVHSYLDCFLNRLISS